MEQPFFTNRPLLPRKPPNDDTTVAPPDDGPSAGKTLGASTRARARRPKQATKTDEEWEAIKKLFYELYVQQNLRLEIVMTMIEDSHGFKASKKQFNTRIKKWKVDKNIKRHEMKAIVRKKNQRQRDVLPKRSAFRVRGHDLDSAKIDRFQRTNQIGPSKSNDMSPPTPSVISCWTPMSQPQHLHATSRATSVSSGVPNEANTSLGPQFHSDAPYFQELVQSPMFKQPISPAVLSSTSEFMNQLVNWNTPTFSPSVLPDDQRMIASPRSHASTFLVAYDRSPTQSARRTASQSPISSRHRSRRSPSSSVSELHNAILQSQAHECAARSISKDPSLSVSHWWPAYSGWSMRKNSPQPGVDSLVAMFQDMVKHNNSFKLEFVHEVKVQPLSKTNSKIEFQKHFPEGWVSCDYAFREVYFMVLARDVYKRFLKDHPGHLAISYVLDKEFWILEIFKKISKLLQNNAEDNYLDAPIYFVKVLSINGLHDEANMILRACIMAIDRQRPNTLAAKQVALDLADNLIYSGNYDEAEDLLRYVLQGQFQDVEVLGASALSGMTFVQDMPIDTKKFFSGRLNIGSVLNSAAEMLEKLRRFQSNSVISGDLPAGMEYMDQEFAGADSDNAYDRSTNNILELQTGAEPKKATMDLDEDTVSIVLVIGNNIQ